MIPFTTYKFLLSQVQCNLAYTLTTFGAGDKVASRKASGRSNFVGRESYLPHEAQTRVEGLSAGMRIHGQYCREKLDLLFSTEIGWGISNAYLQIRSFAFMESILHRLGRVVAVA